MKPLAMVGLMLIVLGAVALVHQAITYTRHEPVIDIGPLHVTADGRKTLPVLGTVAVAGGAVLLVSGIRQHA